MLTLIGKTPDGRNIYRTGSGETREQTHAEREREADGFAQMLRMRRAPGIKTDTTHFLGRHNQFADNPTMGDELARELRAKGGSPQGKYYVSGIARYAGDPEAWVSSRSEVQAVIERRGWGCSGDINVARSSVDEGTPRIPLDPQLVTDEVEDRIAANPEIAPTPKDKERLWNETYENRLPPTFRKDKKEAV